MVNRPDTGKCLNYYGTRIQDTCRYPADIHMFAGLTRVGQILHSTETALIRDRNIEDKQDHINSLITTQKTTTDKFNII